MSFRRMGPVGRDQKHLTTGLAAVIVAASLLLCPSKAPAECAFRLEAGGNLQGLSYEGYAMAVYDDGDGPALYVAAVLKRPAEPRSAVLPVGTAATGRPSGAVSASLRLRSSQSPCWSMTVSWSRWVRLPRPATPRQPTSLAGTALAGPRSARARISMSWGAGRYMKVIDRRRKFQCGRRRGRQPDRPVER